MSPKNPTSQRPNTNNAYRDNGIIQRLRVHRVRGRKAENDCDEADPTNANESDGTAEDAEVEGAFFGDEGALVDEADEDGDPVGDVQPDGGDGSCGCEGDGGAKGGDGEEEGQESGEPDGADWGAEAGVDAVEE
jgi:hypothetical protein